MPAIRSPRLSLFAEAAAKHRSDPAAKVSREAMTKVLAELGSQDSQGATSLADRIRNSAVSADATLSMVKSKLSLEETAEIRSLVTDPATTGMFDATSANFLKALAGLEPLRPVDGFLAAGPAQGVQLRVEPAARSAVQKMRELVQSGKLQDYYRAITGEKSDPALKETALKLFGELPKVTRTTSADQMVESGLWTTKPRGIEQMQKSARFLPGRQVLVDTTVHSNAFDIPKFLSYKEDGLKARTYRASLAGEKGDNYLVKLDGKADPIEVPKSQIHALNQPHSFGEGDVVQGHFYRADYNSPLLKAKVAEAAIMIDPLVAKLDFTKARVEGRNGVLGFGAGEKIADIQQAAVKMINEVIDMEYPGSPRSAQPGRDSGTDVGRAACKGIGMCSQQAEVMQAMLEPFRDLLGVDVQFISGGVYRYVRSPDQNPFSANSHDWLQLTYRPSMDLRIVDRTWQHINHPADLAYSRGGDRYPAGFGSSGKVVPVSPTDADMSGQVSVQTFERQFGVVGRDGRENHMSNRQ